MARYTYLLDPGHGGMVNGEYATSGKRSPEWDDKTFPDGSPYVLYEGVNNRDIVNRLLPKLAALNIQAKDLVDSEQDISLTERSNRANSLNNSSPCVLISIHSNAYGSGWTSPKGIDTFIYDGTTSAETKKLQEILGAKVKAAMVDSGMTSWRGNKKANFAILRQTNCPSVLIEGGFHTNKEEAKLMLTEQWKDAYVGAIVDTIAQIERDGLGATPTPSTGNTGGNDNNYNESEAAPGVFSIPTRGYFKNGDKGPEVEQIQRALDSRDYWTYHTFTENFGNVTETAVKNYQSASGLTVDGLVGRGTLSALGLI